MGFCSKFTYWLLLLVKKLCGALRTHNTKSFLTVQLLGRMKSADIFVERFIGFLFKLSGNEKSISSSLSSSCVRVDLEP